jgi:hypothetical protein
MSITINEAQKRLAGLWIAGAAVSFLLLIWESSPAKIFSLKEVSYAWHWLLPLVLPFLTLIVTSVAAEAHLQNPSTAETSDLAFGIALWLSAVYLIALIGSLLAALWAAAPKPLEILKMSDLWLTPIQGLLGVALGVFFTQQRRSTTSRGAGPKGPIVVSDPKKGSSSGSGPTVLGARKKKPREKNEPESQTDSNESKG